MSYTQQDLEAIKEAIAAGASSVSYAGRTVSFLSLNDLLRIKALIEGELNAQVSPQRRRNRAWRFYVGNDGY